VPALPEPGEASEPTPPVDEHSPETISVTVREQKRSQPRKILCVATINVVGTLTMNWLDVTTSTESWIERTTAPMGRSVEIACQLLTGQSSRDIPVNLGERGDVVE
jgi:hypothetical protein